MSSPSTASPRAALAEHLETRWSSLGAGRAQGGSKGRIFLVGETHTLKSHQEAQLALLVELARVAVEEGRPLLLLFEGLSTPIVEAHKPEALIAMKYGRCPGVIADAQLRLAPLEPSLSTHEALEEVQQTTRTLTRTVELGRALSELVGRWIERPPSRDEVEALARIQQDTLQLAGLAADRTRTRPSAWVARSAHLLLEIGRHPELRAGLPSTITRSIPAPELLEKAVALLFQGGDGPGAPSEEELMTVCAALTEIALDVHARAGHVLSSPLFSAVLGISDALQGLLVPEVFLPRSMRLRPHPVREEEMAKTIQETAAQPSAPIIMAVMGSLHVHSAALARTDTALDAVRLEPKTTLADVRADSPLASRSSAKASPRLPASAAMGASPKATCYDHMAAGWSALFSLDRNLARLLGPTGSLALLSTGFMRALSPNA